MYHVVLYQPEIPPNTGNIIRLCANSGAQLHLIHPLGFDMEEKALRRAGLDYHEFANVKEHASLCAFVASVNPERIFACTTKGKQNYAEVEYQPGDAFLFGPETRGLPLEVIESLSEEERLRIPMQPDNRSLNLSNAVAIIVYEAWRQQGFAGAE
jgi:tRNA (cytidine/uridine-2'-O-)-methyltransferase